MSSGAKQAEHSRIAVLGIGAIGSAYAFQLARAGGHEVTAVARPASQRLGQLKRDGGVVNTAGERAEMRIADKLDENIPYDLVLVTLLAHQVDAVLPALQLCSAKAILFMFNNFEPERLRDAIGTECCSFGMPFLQARLDENGKLNAKIGVAGQKKQNEQEGASRTFQSSRAAGSHRTHDAAVASPVTCPWARLLKA